MRKSGALSLVFSTGVIRALTLSFRFAGPGARYYQQASLFGLYGGLLVVRQSGKKKLLKLCG
jgi:hypothetical protein